MQKYKFVIMRGEEKTGEVALDAKERAGPRP